MASSRPAGACSRTMRPVPSGRWWTGSCAVESHPGRRCCGCIPTSPHSASATPVGTPAPPFPLTRVELLALVSNTRFPTVRVLETTDFHGFILPGRDRRSGRPLGGSAVLAAWIEKLRAENPEGTLLLDGGD